MKTLTDGQVLEVSATDPGFISDIKAWCNNTGNTFICDEKQSNKWVVEIQKGREFQPAAKGEAAPAPLRSKEKTMVVFSGDLDKAIASFIIANGAAAMGNEVTMFFTFWGLNVLRKHEPVSVKKDFMASMFSRMMPRGSKRLGLSKMNMGGMGPKMIRKVMADKNISSLEDLIKTGIDSGIRIVACQMSMDVMGITQEELIDGVEIGGVATYLDSADDSNVNLFI
ncbi:DsrE/DsrF/DrsH-like family protein [Gudongella sp. SC589]|jgi:peroxiredoxin family protein|uniref:DsrE/DsrF/DrsH-like family protein n=1 Tax=Gudongella sp. SC589 TaxID=3385990 RepID=UPI003904D702